MAQFILIHGAWQGGWCWEKVVPLLEGYGHTVLAPDLPGHGQDTTPMKEITLQSYVSCVCEVIDGISDSVILIGHSLGGITISQTAEARPDKIAKLVYVAGFLLPDGESRMSVKENEPPGERIFANLTMNPEAGYSELSNDGAKEALFHDCSEEDSANAIARLGKQPLKPVGTPLKITSENFGRVKRAYIQCLNDRAIVPAAQSQMLVHSPCDQVLSMNTSHSPYISEPALLAELLHSLV